jgi:hypothetical protein
MQLLKSCLKRFFFKQLFASACIGLHDVLIILRCGKCLISLAFLQFSEQTKVVGWPGLEPGTNGLKGRCSTD